MVPTTTLTHEHTSSPPNHNPQMDEIRITVPELSDVLVAGLAEQINSLSAHPCSMQGAFCDLFMGIHQTEGMVALKRPRLLPQDQDSVLIRQFLREARTWRSLRHPNVLRFLGACNIGGFIHLVSPYMRNGTVMDFIRRHPQKANRTQLIREVASALEYLHSQAVIHGDLKGSNVLMSDEEHALLCDFGLSRMEGTDTSGTLKGVGTARWQAPEILDDSPKSFKSDVYAFAITIAEILSGDIPFRQYSGNLSVMRAVIDRDERPPKEPVSSPDGISYEWLWDIAILCWHREPDRRPAMSRVTSLLGSQSVLYRPRLVESSSLSMRSPSPCLAQGYSSSQAPNFLLTLHNLTQAGAIKYKERIAETGSINAPEWICHTFIRSVHPPLVWDADYMEGSGLLFMGCGANRQEARDQAAHNALRGIGFDFAK